MSTSDAASDEWWESLLQRSKRVHRQAALYAAAGKPAAFEDTRYSLRYLVHRSLEHPTEWRVTTLTARDMQPCGHYCTRDAFEAFREVLNGGAKPYERNHPADIAEDMLEAA